MHPGVHHVSPKVSNLLRSSSVPNLNTNQGSSVLRSSSSASNLTTNNRHFKQKYLKYKKLVYFITYDV